MEDEDFLAAVEADNINAPVEDAPEPPKADEPTQEPVQSAPAEVALVEPATPTEPLVAVTPEPPKHDEAADGRLAALLDERDKRKALEARLAQYEQQQALQAQQVQMPDPYEDPEGFARVQEARVQQALYQTNLQWSERIASMQHGEDVVAKAKEWGISRCDADPHFNAKVAASPDPIGLVVQEFKREEIASQVTPDDFAQFQAWKAAQGQLQAQQAAPAAPPNQAPTIPPRSLASAPSAGGINAAVIQGDEEMFEETFGKKA